MTLRIVCVTPACCAIVFHMEVPALDVRVYDTGEVFQCSAGNRKLKQLSFAEVTLYSARTPTALVETTLSRDRFSHQLFVKMARLLWSIRFDSRINIRSNLRKIKKCDILQTKYNLRTRHCLLNYKRVFSFIIANVQLFMRFYTNS